MKFVVPDMRKRRTLLLTFYTLLFFELALSASLAQNLGSQPAVNKAVQGQTAAQPEGLPQPRELGWECDLSRGSCLVVGREVNAALECEQRQRRKALFPIRIDDAIMQSAKPWAAEIRRTRHIADFRGWSTQEGYRQSPKTTPQRR